MDIGDDPRPVDGIDAILSGLMGQLPKAQTPLTSVGDGTDTLARAPPRWRLESVWQEGAEGDAVGGTPADDVSVATDVDGAPLVCLTNARAHRGALVRVVSRMWSNTISESSRAGRVALKPVTALDPLFAGL